MTDTRAGLAAPFVTVAVPNYNHARYLPQRVESVLAQTFGDFELLLLDDASTDDSRDVLRRYAAADPRARCLFNDRNSGGAFAQWNRAVREARGELVWLAESDDFADPRLLERLVAVHRAHPSVGVAFCQSWEVDPDGNKVRTYAWQAEGLDERRWAGDFVMPGPAACARYLSVRNMIPNASAVLFRRDVFLAAGGADASYRVTGDWKLWADMLAGSDLGFVAEPLNYFRHHPSNVRRQVWASGRGLAEWVRVARYLADRHRVPRASRELAAESIATELFNVYWFGSVGVRGALNLRRQIRAMDSGLDGRLARRVFGGIGRKLAARLRR